MKPTRDARSLPREAQAELRRLAVRLHLEKGKPQSEVAELLDVHRHTVEKWIARYRTEGEAAFLANPKRGNRARALTEEQEAWVIQTLADHPDPRDLDLGGAGWTLATIQILIQNQFQTSLHLSNIQRMLHRRGFRPRVARKRATQRSEDEIRAFQENWPAKQATWEAEGAHIVFLDEAQVREDATVPRTWSPRGVRPVIRLPGTRRRIQVISTVDLDGEVWFRCYTGSFNGPRFCVFLEALSRDLAGKTKGKKLVIVLDKHSVHDCAKVKAYLATKKGAIVLEPLPGYAPELNPDEYVWGCLKHRIHRENPIEADEDIEEAVTWEMRELQRDPLLIQQLLHHPHLHYLWPEEQEGSQEMRCAA